MDKKLDLSEEKELAIKYEECGKQTHLYENNTEYYLTNADRTEINEITEPEAKDFIKEIMKDVVGSISKEDEKEFRIDFLRQTMYNFISLSALEDHMNAPIQKRTITYFSTDKSFMRSKLIRKHYTALLVAQAITELLAEELNGKTNNEEKEPKESSFVCPKCGKGVSITTQVDFLDTCDVIEKSDGTIHRGISHTESSDGYVDHIRLKCECCNWSMYINRDSERDDENFKRTMKSRDGSIALFEKMEEIIVDLEG